MLQISKEMSKETSLGGFGFTKILTKQGGKEELVDISKVVCTEKYLTCKFCRERIGNAGALFTYIKCKQSVVISQPGEQSSSTGSPVAVNVTDGEKLEGPSMKTSSSETSGKRNARDKKKQSAFHILLRLKHNDREGGMTPAELVEKYSSFRLDMPKNKQKELIKKAAVEERTNFFKIRPSRKYINLYAELRKVFTNSRGKGHRVDFNRLWLEA